MLQTSPPVRQALLPALQARLAQVPDTQDTAKPVIAGGSAVVNPVTASLRHLMGMHRCHLGGCRPAGPE